MALRPSLFCLAFLAIALRGNPAQPPQIPKTWDDAAMKSLELPLVPSVTVEQAPADYYYRIPVLPIYKSYPVYRPDKEPAGYFEDLRRRQPELLWDDNRIRPKLETEADWISAGELVFDAPIFVSPSSLLGPSVSTNLIVRDPKWFEQTGTPITRDGIAPYFRYVILEQGKVGLGTLSCAMCHTRLMPNGQIVRGAQGNFPFNRVWAFELRSPSVVELAMHGLIHDLFAAPWRKPDPQAAIDTLPLDQIAARFESVPAGVMTRHGTGVWSPVQIPDLIGVRNRRYLDRTGLQRNRGPADIMRYAALNQGLDDATKFAGILASGQAQRISPEKYGERYSDEQLYALTLFLYSLKPPVNPNLPKTRDAKALVARGEKIFKDPDNRCATCHDPKQGYTNNKLVAAPGFQVPENHPDRDHIMRQRVNTDAALTLTTRRGTGFYKVPSLRGVWYRGPFEHNGSVATLEDWFNPARTNDNYVPTGWKGLPGETTRAVKGHEFGLDLPPEDKRALIAFLRTL